MSTGKKENVKINESALQWMAGGEESKPVSAPAPAMPVAEVSPTAMAFTAEQRDAIQSWERGRGTWAQLLPRGCHLAVSPVVEEGVVRLREVNDTRLVGYPLHERLREELVVGLPRHGQARHHLRERVLEGSTK